MKIALFTETFLPKIDGVVSILCLMLRRMEELGHQVVLFSPQGSPDHYAGAEVIGVSGPPLPFYPELRMSLPRPFIGRKLHQFQPDIIHVVNPAFLGPYGLYYGRRHRLPLLASFHTDIPRYLAHYGYGFLSPFVWGFFRTLHNLADLNLGPSTFVRDELRQRGIRNAHWWKRGIDTDFFTPGPADPAVRAQLTDGHPDQFLIVNVGRQSPEKGLFELRDAIFPTEGVRLALVGGGPSHEGLKSHYAGTPTVFPGFLKGQALIEAYRAADLFIFPSTTETFGLVALEAMACGLPVIAVKAGGIVDTVVHGENGFFYDEGHLEQIRPMITLLRDNPEQRQRMANNGLHHARNRSWRATMDQLLGYYERTIQEAEPRCHPKR